MEPQTLNDIFLAIAERGQQRVMLVRGRNPMGSHQRAGVLPQRSRSGAGALPIRHDQGRPASHPE